MFLCSPYFFTPHALSLVCSVRNFRTPPFLSLSVSLPLVQRDGLPQQAQHGPAGREVGSGRRGIHPVLSSSPLPSQAVVVLMRRWARATGACFDEAISHFFAHWGVNLVKQAVVLMRRGTRDATCAVFFLRGGRVVSRVFALWVAKKYDFYTKFSSYFGVNSSLPSNCCVALFQH